MELVILKARAQLNRVVSSEKRAPGEHREHRPGAREGGGARAAGRERSMPPAPVPWLNATLAYNGTFDAYDLLNGTATDEHHHWFCAKWTSAQQDLFQAANLCFAIAFLAPKSFKQSILVLRALAVAGAVLMGMWAGADVCAPDVLAWSLALVFVNSLHTIFLVIRFLPPALSLELTELYLKLFKPLKVNKKHFQELTREARLMRLDPGEAYAVEDVTPADERLSILLKGKLRVSCDETHLHFIQPYQFIDSPEWEANREQSDDVFQVTVVAEEVSTCICWPRMRLERVLRHRQALKVVLDCLIGALRAKFQGRVTEMGTVLDFDAHALAGNKLSDAADGRGLQPRLIGKDITHKLYSVSEGLTAGGGVETDSASAHLTRSASVDAVHEGSRGRLRSADWRSRSTVGSKTSSYWQPVVARQFLRQSPFSRSLVASTPGPPRLLAQASSASLQPSVRKKSPPRRSASFRRGREVKFAEVTASAGGGV